MSTIALDWLRQLNAALSAWNLYREDHPRVVEAVDALDGLSGQLLADRPSCSLFMLEGRLTCEGQPVPNGGAVADKVFARFASSGWDRITLTRGLATAELRALVEALADGTNGDRAAGTAALQSSEHLRFSALDTGASRTGTVTRRRRAVVHGAALAELWQSVGERQTFRVDDIDGILEPLVEAIESAQGGTLPLATLQSHDGYTAMHITNVAVLTMALAESLGMSAAAVRQIGVAALLHDIGKTKVPAAILNSPGRLTPEELALVRRHPEMGARMLMASPGVPPLAAVVAYEHHLQADGGGYPEVPRGWRIHPASAMTHVADVYDALRTHRPYRPALEHGRIVESMLRDRGTVFPGAMLDTFFQTVVPRTEGAPEPAATGRPAR